LSPHTDLIALRKRVGMVFQRPNPFPISVFENVAYGPRVHHAVGRRSLGEIVEQALSATGLWDEVKDKLQTPALALSPEQQQRLCISVSWRWNLTCSSWTNPVQPWTPSPPNASKK
jgi:phosphate transport system ATP-binding protein